MSWIVSAWSTSGDRSALKVFCLRCVRCYIRATVLSNRGRQPSARSVIAIAALLWLLSGSLGELQRSVTAAPDTAHTAASSLGQAVAVNADHTHADHGSSTAWPELFATSLDPRWVTTLVALGTLALVAIVAALFADRVLAPGRGPPCGITTARSGQDLLTRFCLSRR
ncbi:putative copper homeostasis (lipo)protein LpqS [Mycobacterium kiyosense]